MATIGDKLRTLRNQKELTLDEVSKAVGVTRQTYFRYETGEIANIPLRNIEKLASFFNVKPAWLCGWDEQKIAVQLTDNETQFLLKYRCLEPGMRRCIARQVEFYLVQGAEGKE